MSNRTENANAGCRGADAQNRRAPARSSLLVILILTAASLAGLITIRSAAGATAVPATWPAVAIFVVVLVVAGLMAAMWSSARAEQARAHKAARANEIEVELARLSAADARAALQDAAARLASQPLALEHGLAKRAEHLLPPSARSAGEAIANLPLGVLEIDADGRILSANRAAQAMLNLTGACGARIDEVLPGTNLAETLSSVRRRAGDASSECGVMVEGESRLLRLRRLSGDSAVLCVLIEDISELRAVERSRDEFLAHVSHELRTPLTNIRAYAETLCDDLFREDEATQRRCLGVIISETRRLARLVEDVLSVSQIEAGAARLPREPLRIEGSVGQVVQDLQPLADAKAVELSLAIEPDLPEIRGDVHRLYRVWTNLVENAIKYTPAGGSVRVEIGGNRERVCVSVRDTGPGIPAEYQHRIFEKFFRVEHPDVEREGGTGLGLAIARELVHLHGGSIRVESQPGQGASFVVELPVAQAAHPAAATNGHAAPRRQPAARPEVAS